MYCFDLVLGVLNGLFYTREVGFSWVGLKNPPRILYHYQQCRGFSLYTGLRDSAKSWSTVDRLDTFLADIPDSELSNTFVKDLKKKDVKGVMEKAKIEGLGPYVFSNIMSLEILADDLATYEDVILASATRFLDSLGEETVYKCLFVGVTEDGDIKTSKEGGFYISKHTKPEYIFMKIKSGVSQFAFNYKGLDFDSYSLAYKPWLRASVVEGLRTAMSQKVFEKMSRIETREMSKAMLGMDTESNTPGLNKMFYNK